MSATERSLPGRDWPLTGRDAELARISVALEARDSGGVVLAGGAGVGKTRLLREVLARVRESDYIAATRAAASVPFGALSHLMAGMPGTVGLEPWRRAADQITIRASGSRLVLGVDDAHLLDELSAALLHQLVVHGHVAVVATIRADEPAPDAVTALWKDDLARRIVVRPLPGSAVDELVEHAIGPHIEGRTRRDIRDITVGNPLLLRELLTGALEEGALVRTLGVWHWGRGPRYGACLIQLVREQLAGLSTAARTVLEVIACGEPVAAAILGDLADGGILEPRAIGEAERAGLIARERSGRRELLIPAHPLHGEVIRDLLSSEETRRINGWLAVAAQRRPVRRHNDALRLATWRLDAGTAQGQPELIAAADQALLGGDLKVAERLIRAAGPAALGDGGDQRSAMRAWNSYWSDSGLPGAPADSRSGTDGVRAWLLLYSGQCGQALAAVSPTDTLALAAEVLARALSGRAGTVVRLPSALGARDRVLLGWPWCLALLLSGRVAEARAAADEGYEEAVERGFGSCAIALWAVCRGKVALARGRLVAAEAAFREAAMLVDERDSYQFSRYVLAELASVFAHAGEESAARDWMRRSDARPCLANRLFEPWVELRRAWVMAAGGDLPAAADQAIRAARLARAAGQYAVEAEALYDALRFGCSRAVPARLAELAPALDGALGPVLLASAQAFVSRDGHRLDSVGDVFGRMGLLLHAAEACAAAASFHRARGNTESASVSQRRLALLIEACPGARTPLLRIVGDAGHGLTRRESQIALMASSGLSSKDIAAKLHLSVRTVGNHLGHVYAKLGISGRHELAARF